MKFVEKKLSEVTKSDVFFLEPFKSTPYWLNRDPQLEDGRILIDSIIGNRIYQADRIVYVITDIK